MISHFQSNFVWNFKNSVGRHSQQIGTVTRIFVIIYILYLGAVVSYWKSCSLYDTFSISHWSYVPALKVAFIFWIFSRVALVLLNKQNIDTFLNPNQSNWRCTCKKTFKIPNMLLLTIKHSVIKQGLNISALMLSY